MIDRWKNNLGLKIIAVLFAVFLWWTVVNIDDPVDMANFRVSVKLLHTEVVTNQGTGYQIVDDTEKVTVTVTARRKTLAEIRKSDIVATADFRELQGGDVKTIPIRVSVDGYEGEYESVTANPRNLRVQVESIGNKPDVPIVVKPNGEVHEDYVLDKAGTVATPATIDISGPQSLLNKIDKVVATVDVTGLSSETVKEAEIMYYDSEGNAIDKTFLTSSGDKSGVTVKVSLLRTKSVKVNFDTSLIKPAEGYVFSGIEVEPQSIKVAGTEEAIKAIGAINIPAEVLGQEELSENKVVLIEDISKYLPEHLVLADDVAKTVRVNIFIDQVGTKTITIAAASLERKNAPSDFDIVFESEQKISLRFTGENDILSNLTADDIHAYIDLEDCKEEKSYTIPILINEMPEGCTYVGEATVKVSLKKK